MAGCTSRGLLDRRSAASIDDERLGQRVKHALNAQPVYNYPNVNVRTSKGVVQLSGVVENDAQKQTAEEIVQHVRGVTRLENYIATSASDRLRVRENVSDDRAPSANVRATNTLNTSQGRPASNSSTEVNVRER